MPPLAPTLTSILAPHPPIAFISRPLLSHETRFLKANSRAPAPAPVGLRAVPGTRGSSPATCDTTEKAAGRQTPSSEGGRLSSGSSSQGQINKDGRPLCLQAWRRHGAGGRGAGATSGVTGPTSGVTGGGGAAWLPGPGGRCGGAVAAVQHHELSVLRNGENGHFYVI